MKNVHIDTDQGEINGSIDPKFERVLDVFVDNFVSKNEVGASCALTIDGNLVAELWGGKRSVNGDSWDRDTVCTVFSATKGAMALCAHMLADRGQLDLDAPISQYWPEFGCKGKESVTVKMALDHTLGVPHVRGALKEGAFYDYDYMVQRVADEEVFWEPGTRGGYHAITMAWTVGEIIHRVSGIRLGDFFREEVAEPLGLDFWIGAPSSVDSRISPMIVAEPDEAWMNTRFVQTALAGGETPTHLFLRDFPLMDPNKTECHRAEIGSAGGITNGLGLALMYEPLAMGGKTSSHSLLSPDAVQNMSRVSAASHEDATLLIPTRFSQGFMKTLDNRAQEDAVNSSLIISDAAFGHVGAGGSVGFADPDCAMSFGYAMNRMGTGILMNERGQNLIDAVYESLSYRGDKSGAWSK